jgi:acyl-CoA dehydrogenase
VSAVGEAVRVCHREYASDVAAYQQDFRLYLAQLEWAPQWRSASFGSTEEALANDATVLARLYEAGWNRYGWPESAGGLGGNEIHRAVYYDELAHAMLSVPTPQWTLEPVGPALVKFAPHVAATYLPRFLRGDEWWGQGFSEPESGSDLATLRTRATDDGASGYVINGQKIWTTLGATATRLLVLARTGTPESRHRGLTMILVDADAPGVTVRPIALASGRREVAELFFDDVRVPQDRVVGDVGGGWSVAMYLMQYERGMYGYQVVTKLLTQLGRLRHEMSEYGASATELERFARVYISVLAAQSRSAMTVRELANGVNLGPSSSVDKLLFTRAERDVADLTFDARRTCMIASEPLYNAKQLDTARAEWWYSRAATIMGGTVEIQRGIVADHILDLPREML